MTDRLTDEAIDFIESCADEPFFINLHYYAVHRPLVKRSEELYEKYLNKEGDELCYLTFDLCTTSILSA